MSIDQPAETIARATTSHGEVALRRRGSVLELVVDGAFAMDTVDTSTEVALATAALGRHPAPRRCLVGGLGLGLTTRAVLADPRVEHVDVVELARPLVVWAREGLVPELAGLEGERCRLYAGDVADVLAGADSRAGADARGAAGSADARGAVGITDAPAGPWDVILLDVDNGPDFLVHPHNARLYAAPMLASAHAALAPGGVLAIWSSHRAPGLLASLRDVDPGTQEILLSVEREGRRLEYALYLTHG